MSFLLAQGITLAEILKYVSQGGVLGLLIVILFGGYKRWWVFGWIYKESEERVAKAEKERDDWRDIALHGTTLAEQTVDLFKRSRN
jgi:hypothetical protein